MAKLVLEAANLRLDYGLRTVLDIERFALYDGERVGLIGENGAGKSTLLGVLAGAIAPDGGSVRRLASVATVAQAGDSPGDFSPREKKEFAAEETREGLSGGEKTRRRIASALSHGARVLLLDEPTTDLDSEGVERLEERLRAFDGALVLVSHDRALLDCVCTSIAELADGHITVFPGNYSDYIEQRRLRRSFEQFEYEQYLTERARLKRAIQGKAEHASQSLKLPGRMGNSEARLHRRSATEVEEKLHKTRKALESRLSQLEEKERPRDDPAIRMRLGAGTPVKGRNALEIRDMTIRFGGRILLEQAAMALPAGSRTALMGANGCGKTTLISRILGRDPRVRVSPQARLGFFGQDQAEALDTSATALENAMAECVHDEATARTVLARLNLRGDDAFKRVAVLSGGERVKIALARLMLSDANTLVLDEPTNHIDVYTMEALQAVLAEYAGTILFVSHDRRFIEAVATRLVRFEGKKLATFEGGYADWRASGERAARPRGDDAVTLALIEMRMAEVSAKISTGRYNRDELDAQYEALTAQRNQVLGR